jgi:hypothetical protein
MFGIFKSDPVKKLRNAYHAKLTEAMNAQRNGKIREYSFITAEAEVLKSKLDILVKNKRESE